MKINKLQRLIICEEIHRLFLREAQGENVDLELRECGRQLGWSDLPQQVSNEEYAIGLEKSKENKIPLRVYKNRIRSGKSVTEAANAPYDPHNQYTQNNSDAYYAAVAKNNGISYNSFYYRKRRGWTSEEAATLPIGTRSEKKRNNSQ